MRITYSNTCKHCDEPIFWRTAIQGWLHSTNESRCFPTHAEPLKKQWPQYG